MVKQTPSPKTTIFIATPCYGGMVSQEYTLSLLALGSPPTRGLELIIGLQGHDSLITRSRNTLVGHFLDTDATHILFIDADIGFKPEQITRMLEFDEDLVCGIYPLKVHDWGKAAGELMSLGIDPGTASLKYVGVACGADEFEKRGDFVTGEYAGCGFMLIKRAAIERMITAYPETTYKSIHAHANMTPRRSYALFESGVDHQSGVYLSEDFVFCRRFRAMGGKVWLDLKGQLTHVGAHSFVGAPAIGFPLPETGKLTRSVAP